MHTISFLTCKKIRFLCLNDRPSLPDKMESFPVLPPVSVFWNIFNKRIENFMWRCRPPLHNTDTTFRKKNNIPLASVVQHYQSFHVAPRKTVSAVWSNDTDHRNYPPWLPFMWTYWPSDPLLQCAWITVSQLGFHCSCCWNNTTSFERKERNCTFCIGWTAQNAPCKEVI